MDIDQEKIENIEILNPHQEEAFARFGNTDAYKESHYRTSQYSKEQMKSIIEKGNEIYKKISELMDKDPRDPEVQALIQEWRDHISKYFYNCTIEIFRGLAKGYVVDPRFKTNIDKTKEGLAEFLSKAMEIYCDNN